MEHHVYRLSDDKVPVVIITDGPLPPPPLNRGARPQVMVLIGVYEDIDQARAAALWARTRLPAPPLEDGPPLERAGAHPEE